MTQEALKLALEALEEAWYHVGTFQPTEKAIDLYDEARTAIKEALAQEQECWCTTCRPITMADMRFVVCPDCDNKRCPKANDHRNACTNSNEVGQKGSSWEHVKPLAQPEQEPVAYWKEYAKGLQRDYDSLLADYEKLAQPEQEPCDMGEMCLGCSPRRADGSCPDAKPWVGLTDEEISELIRATHNTGSFVRAIEAKLKERNA